MLGTEVGPEQHFFDDLGADSMTMARFCARLRSRVDLPSVSIKDVYRAGTIRALARSIGLAGTPERAGTSAPSVVVPTDPPAPEPVGTPRYLLCGAVQLLVFLVYSGAGAALAFQGLHWVGGSSGLLNLYLRTVALAAGAFVVLAGTPVAAKWLLVGRWTARRLRVWSVAYLRFWVVRTLVRTSPLVLFAGSPLYVLYLRALGARIGRGVTVLSRNVPVCTDLITIGDGSVVRKDSFLSGYRAEDGVIVTGPVTLGRDCYVGEKAVLDVGTSIGDGAQVGNTSSLYPGQAVPAGARWHGSPAQPTTSDYRAVAPLPSSTARRFVFGTVQLLTFLGVTLPLSLGGVTVLVTEVPSLATLADTSAPAFTSLTFYAETLLAAAVLFFGGELGGLLVVSTVPRLFRPLVRPDRIYPLHGVHYLAHRVITRVTNRKVFTELFGDTSFVVGYLLAIGYRLRPVVQTGSNFGMDVAHETPFLCSVGSGTVVADGLSMISADYSASSFRVSAVSIGANNFLGNKIAYPARGRTGDDCLLATKVQIPVDGPVREGVGLLGSPAFEIPRSVERDVDLELPADELRRRLARKNRHNAVSIALRLLVRWLHLFGMLVLATGAWDLWHITGAPAYLVLPVATLLFTALYYALVERATGHLQAHAPGGCSIYDPVFWRHERAWKVPSETYFKTFDGTPFKTVLWRALGVRIGRRVFDDGCFLTERSFTTIGDGATLNAGTVIQCHSQEDGAFKSDHTEIAAGATLGVGAFVHYGVRVGEAAVLAPDSFLMKGEDVSPRALWGGNPAGELLARPAAGHDLRRAV